MGYGPHVYMNKLSWVSRMFLSWIPGTFTKALVVAQTGHIAFSLA
jgi:hypothetical protein